MRAPCLRWPPAVILLLGAVTLSAEPQFRSRVDLVQLPVVVIADDGDIVHGLTAEDFEVLEDGRPQPIAAFVEGAPGRALPLRLGLLLDTSESMEQDLEVAANAAVRFVNTLDEATDVTFIDFDTTVTLGRFQPPSYPQLFERIRSTEAGGGTSLYDALGVFVERSLGRSGQHVVLIHTDGGDSTSSLTFGRLQELLRLGNVIVYVVGYLEHQRTYDRLPQQLLVTRIARETGGEAFFPTSRREMDEAYDRILAEIAARYTIGFTPVAMGTDGRYRKVEVRLTRDGLDGAKVRTRSGYFASGQPGGR